MNQTDKIEPEGNEEVCSTTEVQYAEKNIVEQVSKRAPSGSNITFRTYYKSCEQN